MIVYAIITDYKPKEKEVVFTGEKTETLNNTMELSLLTWNIGYCGLDKEMDFFYDGGTKVFTPKPKCIDNLQEVKKYLKQNDSVDYRKPVNLCTQSVAAVCTGIDSNRGWSALPEVDH